MRVGVDHCMAQSMRHIDPSRWRLLSRAGEFPKSAGKCVIYWCSREQRSRDNWALLHAQSLSQMHKVPLVVCFCLGMSSFLNAPLRHYSFLLNGLKEMENDLHSMNIPFHLLKGSPENVLIDFAKKVSAGVIVSDFSPLRIHKQWVESLESIMGGDAAMKNVMLQQVDAHNVVPVWVASEKLEYAARTIRTKLHNHLSKYLVDYWEVESQEKPTSLWPSATWEVSALLKELTFLDRSVGDVSPAIVPGQKAGLEKLESFLARKNLGSYGPLRNDPNAATNLSGLSPYFHFGHLSPQRAIFNAAAAKRASKDTEVRASLDAFIEEAFVRRELSDNFCHYNPRYDDLKGAADWAQKSLKEHAKDPRPYVYSVEVLEKGETHDDLWNAAQLQMKKEGKMHGFLRMYWAKKILEWTESPEAALSAAIFLNDKYSLDGRDPNGYVGCMWSICGIHDQGWTERMVFGKIRYMNFKGCARKFDLGKFVGKHVSAGKRKVLDGGKEAPMMKKAKAE